MRNWPVLALFAALWLLTSGCTSPRQAAASSSSTDAPPRDGVGLFTVRPDQLAHLTVAPVERTSWSIVVHTTGTVDWNADRTTPAITQVNGPIVRLVANPGDAVTQGQPLLYVSSPDVSNAAAAYRKAQNRRDLTQRIMARDAELLEHHAIAQKDYESARADYNDAVTDLENSLQTLKIFGISQEEMDTAGQRNTLITLQLAVRAPISGIVVQKLVAPGQLIQAGSTTCYVISDVSTVWVQGHIFDHDLPSVRVGDQVTLTNPSLPNVFHGVVQYVGAMLDPATRTTPVRIVTRNTGALLKKDMFLDAVIHTRARRNILVVPTSAVLHNAQNEPMVYVEARPGQFARRLVTAGGQQDDEIEIVSGLKEGEKIVTDGSLFLQFANSYE